VRRARGATREGDSVATENRCSSRARDDVAILGPGDARVRARDEAACTLWTDGMTRATFAAKTANAAPGTGAGAVGARAVAHGVGARASYVTRRSRACERTARTLLASAIAVRARSGTRRFGAAVDVARRATADEAARHLRWANAGAVGAIAGRGTTTDREPEQQGEKPLQKPPPNRTD
jgi:hypothetical protein